MSTDTLAKRRIITSLVIGVMVFSGCIGQTAEEEEANTICRDLSEYENNRYVLHGWAVFEGEKEYTMLIPIVDCYTDSDGDTWCDIYWLSSHKVVQEYSLYNRRGTCSIKVLVEDTSVMIFPIVPIILPAGEEVVTEEVWVTGKITYGKVEGEKMWYFDAYDISKTNPITTSDDYGF
jgi:hypothetical protein